MGLNKYLLAFLEKLLTFFKIYFRIIYDLIVFKVLFQGTNPTINSLDHTYIFAVFFGFAGKQMVNEIIHLYDFISLYDGYLFEPLAPSFYETKILSDDINSIVEKNLKNQEEIKSAKKGIIVWLISATATIIFCTLFFSK